MSRITNCFKHLKEQERKGLITFIVAGDPHPNLTLLLMNEMVNAGANLIELGIPFSDPMADGPVIQKAHERALKHNISFNDITQIVAQFRQSDKTTPVIVMGYMNIIESMGYTNFAKSAATAGIDGVLVVDLPHEDATELKDIISGYGIDLIFMIAPTTGRKRQQSIMDVASGFLYYVSLKGVTGSDRLDIDSVQEALLALQKHATLPIAVGFGIRDIQAAVSMAKISDAIVIGSAIIEYIEQWQGEPSVLMKMIKSHLTNIRDAIDNIERVNIEQ